MAGTEAEGSQTETQQPPEEKPPTPEQLKEQRTKLKEKKRCIESAKAACEEGEPAWKALDALAKEVERQIEAMAAPAQQAHPYNIYIKAVIELKTTEESRKRIQERVEALKEELEAQQVRLQKAVLLEQAAAKAVAKANEAAGLAKRSRDPGEVILAPEPTVRERDGGSLEQEGEAGSILMDLMARLEAGAFGFTRNPDQDYREYVDQWELEHPGEDQESGRMTPAAWAVSRVASHVKAMVAKEPPGKNIKAVDR